MKNKLKRLLISLAVLLFWIAVWEILAIVINIDFVLPRVIPTLNALCTLLATKDFYILVLSSGYIYKTNTTHIGRCSKTA